MITVALQSSLLLAAAWLITRLLNRAPASLRHSIWLTAMLGLLWLPLLDGRLPSVSIAAPDFVPPVLFSADTTAPASAPLPASQSQPASSSSPVRISLIALWATGSVVILLRTLLIWLRFRATRRHDRLLETRGRVAIVESPEQSVPFTYGWRKPVVVLPPTASSWEPEKRELVLLHELAHIHRADVLSQMLTRLVCASYWWNPLAWVAARAIEREQEQATDDLVLSQGARPTVYAAHLVDIARALGAAQPQAQTALPMARTTQLEDRVMAILNFRPRHNGFRVPVWGAVLLAAAFVAPITMIRAQQPQSLPLRGHWRYTNQTLDQGVQAVVQKNYDQAMELLRQVQATDPSQAGIALMWMAIAREKQEQYAEAESLFKSAISSSDKRQTPGRVYAGFLQAQGRSDEASQLLQSLDAERTADSPKLSQSPGVHRVSQGVQPPKLLTKIEPQYTEEARTARLSGNVALYVEVGSDGLPRNITVLRGLGLGLDEAAISAVEQWRFQPGLKDGSPVSVAATIEVRFRLM